MRNAMQRLRLPAAVAVLLMTGAPALAQTPVDPRVNMAVQQSGRMLDANPGLGTGGMNPGALERPLSPLVGGNLSASGLAGRGLSLRSRSPIGYPSEFRASLGSDVLSDFRRDSVSVSAPALGQAPLGLPYFDPARTAPTAGYLRQIGTPGGGAPAVSGPLDLRVSPLVSIPTRPGTSLTGLRDAPPTAAPAAPPAAVGPPTLSSTLFGVQPPTPPRLPLPAETALSWPGARPDAGRIPPPTLATEPLAVLPEVDGPAPLGTALRPELYPQVGFLPREVPDEASRPGLRVPERVVAEPRPQAVDPSLLPGFDVVTDMQLALALLAEPDAPWFREMQATLRENRELASRVDQKAAASVDEFLRQALETPLRSFAAPGRSELNEILLKAEGLMEIGHFTEAADRYEQAAALDRANPLPLLGKSNALLAQGQYASAAGTLQRAIALADQRPGLASLLLRRLELTELLGGGEVVDIRRSDLMQLLEQREDPGLRFLLGFLEYHSGRTESGLDNLRRAAAHPLASAIVARYPSLVSQPAAPAGVAPSESPAPPDPE